MSRRAPDERKRRAQEHADQDTTRAAGSCWRVERANRATPIVDAADYFAALRSAMLQARQRIMLIGWDFDARINLSPPDEEGPPSRLGDFVLWLADQRPALDIYVLRWDIGLALSLFRGTTPLTLAKWTLHKQIHFKLDKMHPPGGSHHQKIVVIDDCLAFCGSIDITSRRWDTREHRDADPRRVSPGGRHHDPWHDATFALDGLAAAALGELARDRWYCAGGRRLEPVRSESPCWPDMIKPAFREVGLAIARTRPKYGGNDAITEIEEQTAELIGRARHFLYVENQYFASRKLAEAVGRRLSESGGPEIVMICPQGSEGWLEREAMDTARARLYEALRRLDHEHRFRMYHPFTPAGVPIYVHAKIMIVDDNILRIGSSNWNNRSLRLDSECDIAIDIARANEPDAARQTIHDLRNSLIAEHLGVAPEAVDQKIRETRSLIRTVEALAGPGKSLRPYETPNLADVEKFLADHEVLDPEGPEEMFEAISRRSLFRRLPKLRRAAEG